MAKQPSHQSGAPQERSPQAKKAALKAQGATGADRRAALRAQQLKQQQAARNRKIAITAVILVVCLAIVGGLVALGVWWFNRPKTTMDPQHMVSNNTAISLYADQAQPNARTVAVYQDFQCPACQQFDKAYFSQVEDLAKAGTIKLQIHTMTFLDSNLPQSNKSSYRAAVAAACVYATSDLYQQYFQTIYANQPTQEGTGYTDDQLKNDFATKAGLSGDQLTKFQACYESKATSGFVTNADSQNEKTLAGITPGGGFSTPSVNVDGKLMSMDTLMTQQALANPQPNAIQQAIDATK